MTNQNLVSRTVVLMPGPQITGQALLYNELFGAAAPLVFQLNTTDKPPHITLFQGRYPLEVDFAIEERLGVLARSLSPISVLMDTFSVFGKRWIWWHALRLATLQHVHEEVLRQLNPLRDQELLATNAELLADPNLSLAGRKSIELYGNPVSGEAFDPHITLGYLSDPADANKVQAKKPNNNPGFFANELVLGEVGEYGTLPKIIRRFSLGVRK